MEIERIACVGSGTIGSGWATLFSAKGYTVNLYDIEEEFLEKAMKNIRNTLRILSENDFLEIDDIEKPLDTISTTTDLPEALKDVDYVQESGPEKIEIKRDLFRKLTEQAPEEAILASSTSGLLMTDIQEGLKSAGERCVIAHPFNPPYLAPLVEIVPGKETSEEILDRTYEFMESLGKVPVGLKKEASGFLANRLQAAVWREACNIVDRDIASVEDVDKAMRAGPGIRWAFMGPFLTKQLGGGEGGIKAITEKQQESREKRREDLADWIKLPYSAAMKAFEQTGNLEIVKKKSPAELAEWRDELLISLLKSIGTEHL